MRKTASVRLSFEELLMVRHALTIGAEDGSLIPQLDSGDPDPAEEERLDRIVKKINASLTKVDGSAS